MLYDLRRPLINKPAPFEVLNIRILIITPIKWRRFINQGFVGFDFHSFLVEKRVFRASGFPAASVPTQLQITHIIIGDTLSKRPCLPSSGSVQTYASSRTMLCRRSSFRSHPSGTIPSKIIAKHLQTSSMLPSTTINRQSNKNSSPNAQTHVSDANLPGSVQNSPQLKDRPSSEILFQISSEWNDCKSDHSQALVNVKHVSKHDNQPPKQQKNSSPHA